MDSALGQVFKEQFIDVLVLQYLGDPTTEPIQASIIQRWPVLCGRVIGSHQDHLHAFGFVTQMEEAEKLVESSEWCVRG